MSSHHVDLSFSMAQPSQYPSPTQTQMAEGTHPFFANQQQGQPDNMHHGPSSNNRAMEANMFASRDGHDPASYRADQLNPNHQLQSPAPPPQDPTLNTPAPKRTKTSRACDQCRSKKVCLSSYVVQIHCLSSLSIVYPLALSLVR